MPADPFMYLSLPLPESRVRCLTVILVHADGSRPPTEYGVEVPHSGEALATSWAGVPLLCLAGAGTQHAHAMGKALQFKRRDAAGSCCA